MLWTIALILLVLWGLGLVTSYTMGGLIHFLLVLAVVVILNKEFASDMEKMFAGDIAASHEIRLEEWEKRPWLNRIREWFAHQFDRWL